MEYEKVPLEEMEGIIRSSSQSLIDCNQDSTEVLTDGKVSTVIQYDKPTESNAKYYRKRARSNSLIEEVDWPLVQNAQKFMQLKTGETLFDGEKFTLFLNLGTYENDSQDSNRKKRKLKNFSTASITGSSV